MKRFYNHCNIPLCVTLGVIVAIIAWDDPSNIGGLAIRNMPHLMAHWAGYDLCWLVDAMVCQFSQK